MFNSNFYNKMNKQKINLRQVVTIAICFSWMTVFTGCERAKEIFADIVLIIIAIIVVVPIIINWIVKIVNYTPRKTIHCKNCRKSFEIDLFPPSRGTGWRTVRNIYCPYCNAYYGFDSI